LPEIIAQAIQVYMRVGEGGFGIVYKGNFQRQNQKAKMISWLNSPCIIYRLKNLLCLFGNLLFNFLYLFLSLVSPFFFLDNLSQLAIPISSNYSKITIGFIAKQHACGIYKLFEIAFV
jgi:hypothetical protein